MKKTILLLFLAALSAFATPGQAQADDIPEPGDTMPELAMVRPGLEQDLAGLGIEPGPDTFSLADLTQSGAELILFEVIGVYCPFCHEQAPLFNNLHKRLARSGLDTRVRMLAVASGATEQEIEHLRKHSDYAYPLLRDQDYSLHAALGEPQTPFTLLIKSDGTIAYTHLGVIKDIDLLFTRIKEELD